MTSSKAAHRDGHVLLRQKGRHEVRLPHDGRLEELGQADEEGEDVQRQDVAVQDSGPRVAARLPVVILHRMPGNDITLIKSLKPTLTSCYGFDRVHEPKL